MAQSIAMFETHCTRWVLTQDGFPIRTRGSDLLPVRWRGLAAMLKVSSEAEELAGASLLDGWNGEGAARVYARDEDALLVERSEGLGSLANMARDGRDDEACRILCSTVARLHVARVVSTPTLTPLARWFRELEPAACTYGGILKRAADTARDLLAGPSDTRVLHGDLHHKNVLDFGARGWLAIDPKGLVGDRGFDYAPLFGNPDLDDPTQPVATCPDRFARRVAVVADESGLDRTRLLRWILAWSGLSAAWSLDDGDPACVALKIAELAAAALGDG